MHRKLVLIAAAALGGVAALTAAAHHPDPPPPDPAMASFASCMRDQGLAVPDPTPNGRGSYTVEDPPSVTPEQLAAHNACDPILQADTPIDKWNSVHGISTTSTP